MPREIEPQRGGIGFRGDGTSMPRSGIDLRQRLDSITDIVAINLRYAAPVGIPSPPLEERARERRPCVSELLCRDTRLPLAGNADHQQAHICERFSKHT